MNRNIGMICSFVAGIAVGVIASYKVAEQKYNNIANEEIESVIERFSNRSSSEVTKEYVEQSKQDVSKQESKADELAEAIMTPKNGLSEYKEAVNHVGYDKVSKENIKPTKNRKKKAEVIEEMKTDTTNIYIITPDEFNTLDGFDCKTLYYSADNYVLDSDCEIMSDKEIKLTIDHDPFGHFGEYEDDSVFVRNEELMCDYEILLSQKTAKEIQED